MERNFLVISMVIIALMACKTDSDPECNCVVKAHLVSGENCSCGLANCDCTLKPVCQITNHAIDDDLSCGHSAKIYGYVNLDDGGKIPVYRTKAVTDTQMVGVVSNVQAGYDGMGGGSKPNITAIKVSSIWITNDVDNADCIADGSRFIIKLYHSETSISYDYKAILEYFATNNL